MNESIFFLMSFILYGAAVLLYFGFYFFRKPVWASVGFLAAAAGTALHSAALVLRTIESGHAPFTNMYESLSFYSWALVLSFILSEKKFNLRRTAPFILLIAVALMALASSPLMPKETAPLIPALQSWWLWLHVSVTLLGEAFLAIAFIASIMFLSADAKAKKGGDASQARTASKLDQISYKCVAIGFPLFTLGGLVFGMIWAYKAWGRYWSWDPKETWSLITWMVFALYLHTRIVMGWKGRRSALVAIIGFLAAMFTFFGVNYLLSGLHSYR